jgi:uncharacterized damage-inducible protein DinB
MGRLSKKQLEKLHASTVRLLRATTWHCGRVERAIVNYLRGKLLRFGSAKVTVREILQVMPDKPEALDALRRLQNRRIIKMEGAR